MFLFAIMIPASFGVMGFLFFLSVQKKSTTAIMYYEDGVNQKAQLVF